MKKTRWFILVLPLALSFSIIEGDLAYKALRLAVRKLAMISCLPEGEEKHFMRKGGETAYQKKNKSK